MPNIDNIVKQLKNRKVFRSLAIYAGFAFVLLQVCSIIIPGLFLPEWTMTFIIILVIIGFPIIAVLSWIYDITPAEETETPPTEATQPLGVYALTGLFLTVIGVGFWVVVGVFGISFGGNNDVPSIGILMMDNLGSKDDEFWSGSMTADLITKVAGAGLIRVAPMNNIVNIDKELNIEEKAKTLRVKYILDHSFHKKENRFDLWYQLINSENGTIILNNKISEPLNKAAQLVGTLANAIITSLGVSTKQDIMKVPTKNADAYEYYLKGKHKFATSEKLANAKIARNLLQKAIEIDDELISAKILLADTYVKYSDYNKAMNIYKRTLHQSEKLDDKRNIAILIRKIGIIYFRHNHNYKKAKEHFFRSLELSELIDDKSLISSALNNIGVIYNKQNKKDTSLIYHTRAMKIAEDIDDKYNIGLYARNIGNLYYNQGNKKKAADYYTRSRKIAEELGTKDF